VTLVRPVGAIPTGPIISRRDISRAGLFACAGVLAALNAQASQIIDVLKYSSWTDALGGLAGISAVIWIAMFAVLKLGLEGDSRRSSRRDVAVFGAVVALSVLPISIAAKGGLVLCGVYLFATSRPSGDDRKIALLLLALTGPLVWGRLLLNLFAAPILSLDAHIVGTLLGSAVDGNTVRFADDSGRLLIATPCSSVHNMSLAILLWVTAAVLFNIRLDRRYIAIGAAMAGVMFALNIARLGAIALFPSHYYDLHVGIGAGMFGWAGLIGAAMLAAFGVTHAAARQR
jgi:hypothetical protein